MMSVYTELAQLVLLGSGIAAVTAPGWTVRWRRVRLAAQVVGGFGVALAGLAAVALATLILHVGEPAATWR